MKKFAFVIVALLIASGAPVAGDVALEKTILDADTAFTLMKGLEGTWVGDAVVVKEGQSKEDGVKSTTKVTYRTIANGTSIIATYREGTPMEMTSMFHQDGPDVLIHTHYCAAGNQPSMRFEKSDEPGMIKFLFSGGTNMDVTKDGHVHNSTIWLIDADTIRSESDLWSGGMKTSTRFATLVREK